MKLWKLERYADTKKAERKIEKVERKFERKRKLVESRKES